MMMVPATYVFTAGPVPPGPAPIEAVLGSVSRVTATPPSVTTAVTFAVNTPGVELLIVTVHVATLPVTIGVAQVFVFVTFGVGVTLGVMLVNETGVAPDGIAVTVTLNVCAWPTGLVALGVIATDAST
jgi:hypothetical protein